MHVSVLINYLIVHVRESHCDLFFMGDLFRSQIWIQNACTATTTELPISRGAHMTDHDTHQKYA